MAPTSDPKPLQALVAQDRATARLVVPAGLARELFTLELCAQTLRDAGVKITKPVETKLRELVGAGPPAQGQQTVVVACAIAPQAGSDARVQWTVGVAPTAPAQAAAPPAAPGPPNPQPEGQRVSLYEHSSFVVVEAGQVLGHCLDATAGRDGCDVTGRTLAAKAGKPLALKLDETILRDSRGQLTAQCPGVLIRHPDSAKISRTLDIPQAIDFSTGNVDFPGDVLVHRGVCDCFSVKAAGNIEVRGIIEGASIDCAGNLTAQGGVAGHERGHLQVAGAAHAKYLDNVTATIRGDLTIEREIINSDLTVGGETRCLNGAIVGGTLIATGAVRAAVLGSNAGTPTRLVIGSMPFLAQKCAELENLIAQLTETRDARKTEQERLTRERFHPTAQDRERQTEILFEIQGLDQKLERARLLLDTCQKHVLERRVVQVDVALHLFHGVEVSLHDTRYQITDDRRGPLRISWKPGVGPVYGNDPATLVPLIRIARAVPLASTKPSPAAPGASHARCNR